MRFRFISRHLLALLTLAAAPTGAAAQWLVSAQIASASFWGGSAEAGGDRSFRPYRPTFIGIGVERRDRVLGLGVRAYYASSGLALEGHDALVVGKGAFDVYGAAAEASLPLGRLGNNPLVIARAGPLLESWKAAGEPAVLRAGFGAWLGLELSLGGNWSAAVAAGAAVSGSPLTRADLEPDFLPRTLWRRELRGVLQLRL